MTISASRVAAFLAALLFFAAALGVDALGPLLTLPLGLVCLAAAHLLP